MNTPKPAQQIQLLRDGYWDRTSIIQLTDNSQRVRKISKGIDSAGPWGMQNLRAEALYLANLEANLQDFFPPLLDHWDGATIGYDMGFMTNYIDVGQIAKQQLFSQQQADAMQVYLAKRLFNELHTPSSAPIVLSNNIKETFTQALEYLQTHTHLNKLLPAISINGLPVAPLEQQINKLFSSNLFIKLEQGPQVRLHGDLFLENMLLPAADPGQNWPEHLILIDPISVAGVSTGHPLFDLGKYTSYANGELSAMRGEYLILQGFTDPYQINQQSQFQWAIDWQASAMAGIKNINWQHQLSAEYKRHYGPVDSVLYELLQAYFAAAMVVCTDGREQQARTLKMRTSLELCLA